MSEHFSLRKSFFILVCVCGCCYVCWFQYNKQIYLVAATYTTTAPICFFLSLPHHHYHCWLLYTVIFVRFFSFFFFTIFLLLFFPVCLLALSSSLLHPYLITLCYWCLLMLVLCGVYMAKIFSQIDRENIFSVCFSHREKKFCSFFFFRLDFSSLAIKILAVILDCWC